MSLKEQVLHELDAHRGNLVSGSDLAKQFSVSRNAVWKSIENLRKEGHRIDAVTNGGYCLSPDSHIFSAQSIEKYLSGNAAALSVTVAPSLPSTNRYLRQCAEQGAPEGKVLFANEQTQGIGRRGRDFFSPPDTGIYLSLLLRPDLEAEQALLITTAAAVAVAQAIEEIAQKEALIKWVNDIYCDGKKVCGILTEASLSVETGKLAYAILGIGINVTPPESGFPAPLQNIATALWGRSSPEKRIRLAAEVLNQFMSYYPFLSKKTFLEDYVKRSFLIGTTVDLFLSGQTTPAKVLSIDDGFRLVVQLPGGEIKHLASGEVSLRRLP